MRTKQDQMLHPWSMEIHADIKPLSINIAYYRNKQKSSAYRLYEDEWQTYLAGLSMPDDIIVKDMKFAITMNFGFSNKAADVDNPIKPLIDVMQNWMGFNDKQVYTVKAYKHLTKRGKEFTDIKIKQVFDEDFTQYNRTGGTILCTPSLMETD